MRKVLILLLAVMLLIALVGCDENYENYNEAVTTAEGEAITPDRSSNLRGKNYQDVELILKGRGFTNIRLEPIYDLITGWLVSDGDVEEVSINGDTGYRPGQTVAADSTVVVRYHTFSSNKPDPYVSTDTSYVPTEGEAKTPSGSSKQKNRPYSDVVAEFTARGFTNIRTEPIRDLITGWLTSDGSVEDVSVDGDTGYLADQIVAADTEVVIRYHTFSEQEPDPYVSTDTSYVPTEGEAKTPSGSSKQKNRPYSDVVAEFTARGFTNIRTEPIRDLITGWLTSDGSVEDVSVGGDTGYLPDQIVAADTEVVIRYHTFPESSSGNGDTNSSASTDSNNYDSALAAAQSTLTDTQSRSQLIKALEQQGYTTEAATYGADNCNADWNANALRQGQASLRSEPYSFDGLVRHLKNYKFTEEEATYAAQNCGADWNANAIAKAQEYLRVSNYSAATLARQLRYVKFTDQEAEYGANHCGANYNEQAYLATDKYIKKHSNWTAYEVLEYLMSEGYTSEQIEYAMRAHGMIRD